MANIQVNQIVNEQFPNYIRDNYQKFIDFVRQYYISQEYQGGVADLASNFTEYKNLNVAQFAGFNTTAYLQKSIEFFEDKIYTNTVDGWPNTLGILKIDDEIITYTGITTFINEIGKVDVPVSFNGNISFFNQSNGITPEVFSQLNVNDNVIVQLELLNFDNFDYYTSIRSIGKGIIEVDPININYIDIDKSLTIISVPTRYIGIDTSTLFVGNKLKFSGPLNFVDGKISNLFPGQDGVEMTFNNVIIQQEFNADVKSFDNCFRGFGALDIVSEIPIFTDNSVSNNIEYVQTVSADHKKDSRIYNLSNLLLKQIFEGLKATYAPGFENRKLFGDIDVANFIRQISDLYRAKGSAASFDFLFKALFNKEVFVSENYSQVIRPSDSTYVTGRYVLVEDLNDVFSNINVENTTLYQEAYPGYCNNAEATIGSSSAIFIENKKYLKLFLTNETQINPNLQTDVSDEFIVPPLTKLTVAYEGGSILNVDSTLGFLESPDETNNLILLRRVSDGYFFYARYESTNSTQFLGVTGLENEFFERGDSVEIQINVFTFNQYNNKQQLKFSIKNILNGNSNILSDQYNIPREPISFLSVGSLPTSYNSLKYNNYLFNIATTLKALFESYNLLTNQSVFYLFLINTIELGDVLYIFKNNNYIGSGTIIDIDKTTNLVTLQLSEELDLDFVSSYNLERSIRFANSEIWPNISEYPSNVQNTYKIKNDASELDSCAIFSSGLPSYTIEATNRSENFYGTGIGFTSTIVLNQTNFLTGDSVNFLPLNGYEIQFYVVNDRSKKRYLLEENQIYYVQRIDSNNIRIYFDRPSITNGSYFVFYDNDSLGEFQFIPSKLYGKSLSNANQIQYIPLTPKAYVGENDLSKINPGNNAVLANGVNLVSAISEDNIFYGAITEVSIVSPGEDYDVLSVPNLYINPSQTNLNDTAKATLQVTGSLKGITINETFTGWLEPPVITIIGGNGITAKAQAILTGSDNQKQIDFIEVIDEGSGYINSPVYIKAADVDTSQNLFNFKSHPFLDGQRVRYSVTDPDGDYISGLSTSIDYYVIKINDDQFSLATTADNVYKREAVIIYSVGQNYNIFNYSPISVNISGITTNGTIVLDQSYYTPVFRGSITNVFLYENGVGYGNSSFLNYLEKPYTQITSGEGAFVVVNSIVNGVITSVTVTTQGNNYTTSPVLEVLGKGTGAVVKPVVVDQRLVDVILVSGGQGYDDTTVITVTPVGLGANINAKIQNWTVDLYSRYFNQLTPDWGYLLPDNFESILKYSHFIVPPQLRRQLGESTIDNAGIQTSLPYSHSPLVGFAYDGNPIYGPYAYEEPLDPNSPVKLMRTSYSQNFYNTNRPDNFIIQSGLSANQSFFIQDWQYNSGFGDLDQFNGRFCVTPEYPNGVYAYFSTYEGLVNTGYINVTLQNGDVIDIQTYFSTRYDYSFVYAANTYGFTFYIFSEFDISTNLWKVLLNNSTEINIPYIINNTELITTPVFPYVLANNFQSIPDSRNFNKSSKQNSIPIKKLIRNVFPYNLDGNYANYDYFLNKKNFQSEINVNVTSSGKLSNIKILEAGEGYRVDTPILFNDTNTSGGGASARIKTVYTVPLVSLSYESNIINCSIAYNGRVVTGITTVPHLIRNNEYVTIGNIANPLYSFIQGPQKIKVDEAESTLVYPLENITTTGIVTTISLSGNPSSLGVKVNSILGIGTGNTINVDLEQFLVLNVYGTQNSVRVLRAYNDSNPVGYASTGNIVRVLPNEFRFDTLLSDTLSLDANRTEYFDPIQVTSIGSSIFNITDHGFAAGQKILYSPVGVGLTPFPGSSITVNLESGPVVNLIDIPNIYINYLSENTFNLSVTPLPSGSLSNPNILYVAGYGSTFATDRFTTLFNSLEATAELVTGIVSTSAPPVTKQLGLGDVIQVDIIANTDQEVFLSFGSTSRQLFTGVKTFSRSDINISRNSITIIDHSFTTGDVVEFYSDFVINTTNVPIQNYQNYFVYVISKNELALATNYIDSKSAPASIIEFVSVFNTGNGSLSLVNSEIKLFDENLIKFDVSDISFQQQTFGTAYKELNFYKDPLFSELILPYDLDGNPIITRFRDTGQEGAYVLIYGENLNVNQMFYRIDSSPSRQEPLKLPNNNGLNSVDVISSLYNGIYTINYVNNDASILKFNLPQIPEAQVYNSTNTKKFTFSTFNKNVIGGVASVELVSTGSNYKRLPGYSIGVGTGAIFDIESVNIGKIEKLNFDNYFDIYTTDPSLLPTGIAPTVLQVYNVSSSVGFTQGEEIFTDTFRGNIISPIVDEINYGWNAINNQINVIVTSGEPAIGQTLTGSLNGVTATIESIYNSSIEFETGPLTRKSGLWINNIGFLNDSSQRVHDNNYYQIYAYTVASEVNYDEWDEPVSTLIHPIGYKKFGSTQVITSTPSLQLTVDGYASYEYENDLNIGVGFGSEIDLYAKTSLLAPISTGSTQFYVLQNDPLFVSFASTTQVVNVNIVDPVKTSLGLGVTPYPEVGITTFITNAKVLGDYGTIIGVGQTNRIIQDLSLGISSFVVFRLKLDDAFNSIGSTEPRLVDGDYFVTNYTNIDTYGNVTSYGQNISEVVGIGTTFYNCVWQALRVISDFDDFENNYNVVCHGNLGVSTAAIIENKLFLIIILRINNIDIFVRIQILLDFVTFNLLVEQRNSNIVVCNCPNTSVPNEIPNGYLPVIQRDLNEVDCDLFFVSESEFTNRFFGNYSWGKFYDYDQTLSQTFDVNYLNGFESGISTAPVVISRFSS